MSFKNFNLSPRILRALEDISYKEPSPIQQQAIPLIEKGSDLMACAQTGTGKTAAFSLPLIERIAARDEEWRRTTVLILSPTRELASQIVENINAYTKYLPVRCAIVYGGVRKEKQLQRIHKGAQIIVATPGRLLDYLNQKSIDLRELETLVLDEADRMLDMGFIKDVQKIIRFLPKQRQTLLFSATLSGEIKNLGKKMLRNPKLIQIEKKKTTAHKVKQSVCFVSNKGKTKLLSKLLKENKWKQVLVFTRTKKRAQSLSEELNKNGHQSLSFHGDHDQRTRERILKSFKEGKVNILVATDIAARGIDIEKLPIVINFALPEVPENYVHRIGRTGRAGEEGKAISFVSPDQQKYLDAIEKLIKKKIPEGT